jgi:hypothetical protein
MKRVVLGGRTAVSPKAVRRAAVILLALATALALLAMIDAGTVAAQVAPGGAHNHAAHEHHHGLIKAPPAPPKGRPTAPLAKAPHGAPAIPTDTQAEEHAVDPIDLKVLVLSADGKESNLPGIKQALDYLGTPYEVHVASQNPGGLTARKLWDGSIHAYYQGVILTSGDLAYQDASGNWTSALSPQEWNNLWEFEAAFDIRQITWYTYPSAKYGFEAPSAGFGTSSSLSANFTPEGDPIWNKYVNTSNPVRIENSYAYTARAAAEDPATGITNTPVLSDGSGNALGLVRRWPDGRENLALTFDSNQYLRHNQILSYGLVNWVTKGMFLGERHVYMNPQPDDFFLNNVLWSRNGQAPACGTSVSDPSLDTYRMTASDLRNTISWQNTLPGTQPIRMEMPFNGWGTTGVYAQDDLTPAAKQNQAQFKWVGHTYDHTKMDGMTLKKASWELSQNNQVAANLGLSRFTKASLITPEISGLNDSNVMRAAYNNGVRNLVSDYSRSGVPNNGPNPTPNAGFYNSLQPSILTIPRRATNLFFNVSKPEEWVAEYNCVYKSYWGKDLSYQEVLDKESDMMLSYLLNGDMDPLMFHQANLRTYDGKRTLLTDLLDTTLAKYNRLYTLPIQSPTQEQIGQKMAERMQYNGAGVSARVIPPGAAGPGDPGSITITAQKAATVPVTGLKTTGAEVYGGQHISYVKLAAGQSVTIPLQ